MREWCICLDHLACVQPLQLKRARPLLPSLYDGLAAINKPSPISTHQHSDKVITHMRKLSSITKIDNQIQKTGSKSKGKVSGSKSAPQRSRSKGSVDQVTVSGDVVACINSLSDDGATQRIKAIVQDYVEAEKARKLLQRRAKVAALPLTRSWAFYGTAIDPRDFAVGDTQTLAIIYTDRVDALNTKLRLYASSPSFHATVTRIGPARLYINHSEHSEWEESAVEWLFDYATGSKLNISLFRPCSYCGRWLYQKPTKKIYCSNSCRVGVYNKTPLGRLKHADAQKKYRLNIKAMDDATAQRVGIKDTKQKRRIAQGSRKRK
jgi:hypothetical protein